MALKNDAGIGTSIAPPRFLLFLAALALGVAAGQHFLGRLEGTMAGFDVAALVFFIAIAELFNDEAGEMRQAAARNDANRALLLIITVAVTLVILIAVAAELKQKQAPDGPSIALIVGTLFLAWTFSNVMYALHYAHLFYGRDASGGDSGGIDFPKTKLPTYWDFVYFSFTLGMTFQTSDSDITNVRMRRIAVFHCLAAFIFNLGVIAFTINVLGSGGS
ncbi:MAG: DUF1345 domain-containing protein [Sphingomonadaceae bacterium]|nr:DUF1345 domain-containing protein [Sphingomonadaceae bacterium]